MISGWFVNSFGGRDADYSRTVPPSLNANPELFDSKVPAASKLSTTILAVWPTHSQSYAHMFAEEQ